MNELLTKEQLSMAVAEIAKYRSAGASEEDLQESLNYVKQEMLKRDFDELAKRSYTDSGGGALEILPVPKTVYDNGVPLKADIKHTEPIGYFISRLPIPEESISLELKDIQESIKPYIGDKITDPLIESLKEVLKFKISDMEDRYKLEILKNFNIYIEPDEVLRIYLQPII